MLWQINTDNTSIELTAYQVINTLTAQVISKERPDHEALSRAFAAYLQSNEALTDVSIAQLISMSFELGYFYRIMNKQNTVKIIEDPSIHETDTSTSGSTPTD